MVTIEKGIPIPKRGRRGRAVKYPFLEMEVGDSFEVPDASVKAAASSCSTRHPGRRFVTETQENGHVRVWRTE